MDGTLVDSHASIEAVWFEFAQRHDVDRSIVAEALPGRLAADIVLRVLGPAADVRSELQWIRERERRSVVPVQPIAGAARFLASVPPERWAVVTSATRSMMVRRLTAAGLPTPRIAVAAEDVTVGKPAPAGSSLRQRNWAHPSSRASCSRTRRPEWLPRRMPVCGASSSATSPARTSRASTTSTPCGSRCATGRWSSTCTRRKTCIR
nr:hypothetical protein [Rhodococcus sp. 14-2470-1b]